MATPAAMCATHRLTAPSFARAAPRARPRASSRSRGARVHASGESAGVGSSAARNGADETPSTSGAVSDPTRDFAVAPSPSKRRASAGRAKHRRGAISAEWGSGEFDGFDDAGAVATPPSLEDEGRRETRGAFARTNDTRRGALASAPRVETRSALDGTAGGLPSAADGRATKTRTAEKPTQETTIDADADTELVMVLERRGEGWAEEVFPHVAMRRRPVAAAAAAAASRRSAPDSAQAYLEQTLGMSRDEAATIVSAAAAWRVTRGGRALVDRKIMRAVQANARAAVEALCELGASIDDVPDLLRRMPQILAVAPKDEWNRNLLEYVVRARAPGGGRFGPLKLKARLPAQKSMNQAEASIERRAAAEARKTRRILKNEHILGGPAGGSRWTGGARNRKASAGDAVASRDVASAAASSRRARAGADPLKPWVEDVRDKRQCGRLTQEQLYLLDIAGFDATVKEAAGGESNRTWEMWFDELVEYKSVVGSCEVPENRADAGLGLWVQRQRRRHAEGTLPEKALHRLLALGVSVEGIEPTRKKEEGKGGRAPNADESSGETTSSGRTARLAASAASSAAAARAPRRVGNEAQKRDSDMRSPPEEAWASANASVSDSAASAFPAKGGTEEALASPGKPFALDRETTSMIASLRAFQKAHGEFAEPPLGSELAVWLATVRARAATVVDSDGGASSQGKSPADDAGDDRDPPGARLSMSRAERDALLAHGVELENFSPVWLGELERFASLRAHRVTLHDPKAHAAFVRRERAAANAGLCSRARLMRLRHVGMSGIAGALLLDDCELEGVDECLSAASPYADGSDGGSLAAKTVAALPLRENALAREAARAAREEAEKLSTGKGGERRPRLFSKPSARARARPVPVDAPVARRRRGKPAGEGSETLEAREGLEPFASDDELAERTRTTAVYVDELSI